MTNWWLPIFLIAPFLVFSITPEANAWVRSGRFLVAIAIMYVMMNLDLYFYSDIEWGIYRGCQRQFSDGYIQHHEECLLPIDVGITLYLFLMIGWLIAASYIGCWEIVWRLYYVKAIKAKAKDFKGKWMSNLMVLTPFILFSYASYLIFRPKF